jgi:hypothetical protein
VTVMVSDGVSEAGGCAEEPHGSSKAQAAAKMKDALRTTPFAIMQNSRCHGRALPAAVGNPQYVQNGPVCMLLTDREFLQS